MRKAQLSMSLKPIIGIILAIIVIIATFSLFFGIFKIFFGSSGVDQPTAVFFMNLETAIDGLSKSSENSCYIQGSIDKKYGFFFFDVRGEKQLVKKEGFWGGSVDYFERPLSCAGRSCACLCEVKKGEDACLSGKCFNINSFDFVWYPANIYNVGLSKNEYSNYELWWGDNKWGFPSTVDARVQTPPYWVQALILGSQQGEGTVWAGGAQSYILKKQDSKNLLIKRIPLENLDIEISNLEIDSKNIKPCSDIT